MNVVSIKPKVKKRKKKKVKPPAEPMIEEELQGKPFKYFLIQPFCKFSENE